jgi:phosphate uptake regulator
MKIYGYTDEGHSAENAQPMELAEATLVATPTELRAIAKFIERAADHFEKQGKDFDHEHLCDSAKEFINSPQLIVARAEI